MSRRVALCTWSDPSYVDPEPPAIAESLRARGHQADVLAWHSDTGWDAFDLVVIRSTWDYFGKLDEFLKWVDAVGSVTRIINPPSVIRWNSHKGYLSELGGLGIPVLPSLTLAHGALDGLDQLARTGWSEVVIKPAVDGGARSALKAAAASRVAADHLDRLVRDGDVIVQPYAPSVVQGETSLLFFDGELSHAVRKVPKDGDYRVQALHGGTEEVHEATAGELDVAVAAMALAPGELAYARADFIDVQGEPTLMELELIEPDLFLRTSPGSLERCVDMVEAHLP